MYTTEKAKDDFARIAAHFDFSLDDDLRDEATSSAAKLPEPVRGWFTLVDLLRATNEESDEEFADALLEKDGFLWTLVFADLDGGNAVGGVPEADDLLEYLDDESKGLVEEGALVARSDADVWVLKGAEVFRVHPEGASSLGDFEAYLEKQIGLVLA